MSLLEERYRHVLRLLPASYRAEREEEMVCALLEGAGDPPDAENPRPRWSEIISVAALAMRVRLGGIGAAPRFFAWGQAVRLVAMLGLFFHAMMSCVWLADLLRLHGIFDSLSADHQTALGTTGSAQRLQEIVRMFTYLLWIATFASLVDGRPRTAKALALIALVLFYSPILQARGLVGDQSDKALALHSLLLVAPVLALLAGFHRDAPRTRHSWRGAALPVSLGALLYMILNVLGSASMAPTINWQFWSWMWPAIDPATQTMVVVNTSQLLALLLCALTLTVLTAKTMPALPQTTPSSP